jgi:hypothetical protein
MLGAHSFASLYLHCALRKPVDLHVCNTRPRASRSLKHQTGRDRFDDCSPNTHREHTLTATGDLGEMQDLVSHTRVPMISKALIEREC